jgi:viroplasmin and RNaseH domain-containing protein
MQPSCGLLRTSVHTAAGAEFKSFHNQQEARIWLGVAPQPPAAAAAMSDSGTARRKAYEQQQQQQQLHSGHSSGGSSVGKFYAIARGRSTGVFPGPWDSVKGLVEGYSNPVYKGFATHTEAEAYLEANSTPGGGPQQHY